MSELLCPAGDFKIFKQALYSGADAIYLACEKYGARAYAKNLSIDELKEALILAHEINKKIYVTVNTSSSASASETACAPIAVSPTPANPSFFREAIMFFAGSPLNSLTHEGASET